MGGDLVLVVVGNKADLVSQRAVPEAVARTLAAARGAHYYETSAHTNLGRTLSEPMYLLIHWYRISTIVYQPL